MRESERGREREREGRERHRERGREREGRERGIANRDYRRAHTGIMCGPFFNETTLDQLNIISFVHTKVNECLIGIKVSILEMQSKK